ncbi:hypothetical protein NE865_00255 [Phthorimaea operculella]|nr:hypothetical protein NE865_00255 [Phthorimaea operculella]
MSRLILLSCLALLLETVLSMKVTLSKVGPVVRGSNVTFTATITDYDNSEIEYDFRDDAEPQHYDWRRISANTSTWVVEYPRDLYEAGEYSVSVVIKKNYFGIFIYEDSDKVTFNLTESLNGNLVLLQNNTERPNSFVAVNKSVTHYIKLPENEMQFLIQKSSQIITYWFIDCNFYDKTTDFAFNYTYSDPMMNAPHKVAKRAVSNKTKHKASTVLDTFICKNANVPIGPDYTYGHYRMNIGVREPIATVNITGLNWLQHGDLMNLQVKYAGSPPFDYCAEYKPGQYNITGNETCRFKTRTVSNVFPLVHYFSDSDQHTVVVVIENDIGKVVSRATINIYKENDIGKVVSRATINIYKASVHAQLSVIVVPVVSCLLAVILIVFGIAYYQHRSRYNIEVADFDFGQQSHFDYKTFTERLRDSFRGAFHFGRSEDTDPLTNNTRYDSMT